MIEHKNIYDISVLPGEESIDYPGDTPYSHDYLSKVEEGGAFSLSKLQLSAHSGTHIDAPAHFIANGKPLDQIEIDRFICSALVVNIKNPTAVTSADLSDIKIHPGDALLFRTDNSTSGRCRSGVFSENYVYISKEAAKMCVEKKAAMVGIDYITIEQYGNVGFDAHHILLSAGVLILEGIHLDHVPEGRYTLLCLPLKMKGIEASPVRAILLD